MEPSSALRQPRFAWGRRRGPGLRVCSEIRVASASSYSFAPMADLQGNGHALQARLVVLVSKSFGHAARQIVFSEKIDATEDAV